MMFKNFLNDYVKFPLYILTHPFKGYNLFKEEKMGKMKVAVAFLITVALLNIINFRYMGFIMNNNNPRSFNSLLIVIYAIVPVILLSVANWSVTTLMDGKGKMKEIFMMLCYSYFPVIVTGLVTLFVSHWVVQEEVQFLNLLNTMGYVMMCFMVFMGLVSIHEYGLFKTVATILVTAVAASIILFICLLIFDLSQQIYGFLYSLYREITTRFI
jgi:hypothetical protein